MNTYSNIRKLFLNPPIEYRSIPFWSWNDSLEQSEIACQITEMKDKGMGGFFMHSRDGLETPYLGDQWMKCVKAAVDSAKSNGIKAWLYDEDRWPSGMAGGLVVQKGGDAVRAKGLTIELTNDDFIPSKEELALFSAEIADKTIISLKRIPHTINQSNQGQTFLVFRQEISGPSTIFLDEAPSDNLSPESVKAFIDITYSAYEREVGNEFGKAIPGIFSDEPSVASCQCSYTPGRGWVPWTEGFAEFFKTQRGYDILDLIPYLFLDGAFGSKVRHDYWRTITERFCQAYTQQLYNWCDNHNIAFAAHMLDENTLGSAIRESGSTMPHYRYMHIPGVDSLFFQIDEYMTVNQCTSVARQYGKKRVIVEAYAGTGWEFDFEGQKWIGDFHYAFGVNYRCQHLTHYSLKGCRKRDYPPTFNYQTSWWKYNKLIEDYYARLGAVLTQGDKVCNLLILHPSSSAWTIMSCSPEREKEWWKPNLDRIPANTIGDKFNHLLKDLSSNHFQYDLGDEILIEESSSILHGNWHINKCSYSTIVIAYCESIFQSTAEKCREFLDQGGHIIILEKAPGMIEGVPTNSIIEILNHPGVSIADSVEQLIAQLEKRQSSRVRVTESNSDQEKAKDILSLHKKADDFETIFLFNTDRKRANTVLLSIPKKGTVSEWDPLNGTVSPVETVVNGNNTTIVSHLEPVGSRLFVINTNEEVRNSNRLSPDVSRIRYRTLDKIDSFTCINENALTLDYCTFRIKGETWSEPMEITSAQREIRKKLGYYNGTMQRYKWINEKHKADGTQVELKLTFNLNFLPEGEVFFVSENIGDSERIFLNGKPVDTTIRGWYFDRSFSKIALTNITTGINEIILNVKYYNKTELESCYIIGDFGVNSNRTITKKPSSLQFGDWVTQGYFHYNGSIAYHFEISIDNIDDKRVYLSPGQYSAVILECFVNSKKAGVIPWRAVREIDITDFLMEGKNQITIEAMGSPRNLMGPFRKKDKDEDTVYKTNTYGLLTAPELFIS